MHHVHLYHEWVVGGGGVISAGRGFMYCIAIGHILGEISFKLLGD